MNILIGADPEIFVKHAVIADEGSLVSAHGMNEGTKESPLRVDKGAVQVDGMALEFNIDPASTAEEFSDHIQTVLTQLDELLPSDHHLAFGVSTAHFGSDYINSQPEDAKELGCDPDFNAYRDEINPAPNVEAPFRTAAGHVHIGWTSGADYKDQGHRQMGNQLAKVLDLLLGVPSVLLDPDTERRQLYGQAGAVRYKHYGVEYRTLSNFWVGNPVLEKWVFQQVQNAIIIVQQGDQSWSETEIQKIINNSDVELAQAYVDFYDIDMPEL